MDVEVEAVLLDLVGPALLERVGRHDDHPGALALLEIREREQRFAEPHFHEVANAALGLRELERLDLNRVELHFRVSSHASRSCASSPLWAVNEASFFAVFAHSWTYICLVFGSQPIRTQSPPTAR